MSYIDREKLIAKYDRVHIGPPGGARKLMEDAPSADVVEVKHGRWINTDSFDSFKTPIYQCSVCIREVADNYIHLHKYCLHCGAKMDGKEEGNADTKSC